MKNKTNPWLGLILALVFLTLAGSVRAIDLALTKIGSLSTIGVDYSIVNYSGGIPSFEGTASPGAQVLVRIKTSTDATTAASPSGVWKFLPGVMDPGGNQIVITSGSQTIAFVMNFNATPSSVPTATPTAVPAELPKSGEWEYFIPIVGAGLSILFLGRYIKGKMLAWEGKKEN